MPENVDPLAAGLEVLSAYFVDDGTVGDTLLRVAEIARQMV